MSQYRYLDHPRPDPSEQVHVRVQLDDASGAGECLWAHPLGADLYRILNVPFCTSEVGLDDIVLALTLEEEPEFIEVVARRSHVRFCFELPDQRAHDALSMIVEPLGVAVEGGPGLMFVANLPDRANAAEFQGFLETTAVWFECVDLVGATPLAQAREDVSSSGGDT